MRIISRSYLVHDEQNSENLWLRWNIAQRYVAPDVFVDFPSSHRAHTIEHTILMYACIGIFTARTNCPKLWFRHRPIIIDYVLKNSVGSTFRTRARPDKKHLSPYSTWIHPRLIWAQPTGQPKFIPGPVSRGCGVSHHFQPVLALRPSKAWRARDRSIAKAHILGLPVKASPTVFMRKAAADSIEAARFFTSISPHFSCAHTSPVPNAQRNRKSI